MTGPARIIAHKPHADLPGTWWARKLRYGTFSLEVELPCINGVAAWFTVATFHEAGDDERLMTDGARQEAGEYAAKFAALATWMGGQVASEKDALLSDMLDALYSARAAIRSMSGHVPDYLKNAIADAEKAGIRSAAG